MQKYKIILFDSLPSTQVYARELIAAGKAMDKIAIVADVQTKGVGRRGNKWESAHGNLYLSCIIPGNDDPRVSYCAGLAVSDALKKFGVETKVKWPNDVYAGGGKISGSLVEIVGGFMIIGIGINLGAKPDVAGYPTACAADFGKVISRDAVLKVLLKRLDHWIAIPFEQVRDEWMRRAMYVGDEVEFKGRALKFMGIDSDGALVLGENVRVLGMDEGIVWGRKR
ncbi:MAG: biotin--[acetyl-CoA-carboxylase] ligase [Alphaproteobacteria bacterium]|nr:biotin--[acetyl-CoA-carboxylase] ligase [Alphaproteobacteria bacterium]